MTCRGLWAAVVLQALNDIRHEPLSSIDYLHATHFFTEGSEWAKARAAIGDQLGVNADALECCGRTCINARRAAEGLELLPPGACLRQTSPRSNVMTQRATFVSRKTPSVVTPSVSADLSQFSRPEEHSRRRKLPPDVNPFFPNGIVDYVSTSDAASDLWRR